MFKAGYWGLVFFGLLAYINAIRHPFVHDDVIFILQNPHITELKNWFQAFQMPSLAEGVNTYYRPVLEVIYRLEYHFFGTNPYPYHLVNIILHIINGLMVYSLLQKLNLAKNIAWMTALIFLVHPVQTEAVSCIAGISNLWMAFGVLLGLHAYLNKQYLTTLLCFVAAFLGKEQAVMFVPLVMVIDISRGEKKFLSWFLWAAVTGVLLGLRHGVTGASLLHDIMASPKEFYLRLAAIPRVMEMDLRLIFFPYDLHYYRNTDILQSNRFSWVLALIYWAGLIYTWIRWRAGRSTMILGIGWFLAALLPVLNIVSLVDEYSFILTPEHFLYLPLVGVLIVVVAAADHCLKRFKIPLAALIVGVCIILSWYQNSFWRSEITLFERMLQFENNFGRGHMLLAKAYYFNGQPAKAQDHFARAYAIMSRYAKIATNATAEKYYIKIEKEILFDWAQDVSMMGQWPQALMLLKKEEALGGNAAMYNNMAFVYLHMGDKTNAYNSLNQALRIDPSFSQARRNLEQLGPP